MYAVSKEHRSSKLFVNSRRAHLPQNLDNFDGSIKKDAKDIQELCSTTKPLLSPKRLHYARHASEEISEQHEAMIRYINDSWRCIKQELEYSHKSINGDSSRSNASYVSNSSSSSPSRSKIHVINGCSSSSIPKNFVPFDLDSFWGQRLYQNLLQSS